MILKMKCICCGVETEKIIGELHDKEKMTCKDIEYLCFECFERNYTCCSDCGVWVHNDDICTVNRAGHEVYVCSQCCKDPYS